MRNEKNSFSRLVLPILLVVVAAVGASCRRHENPAQPTAPRQNAKAIRVGVLVPLSGSMAEYGHNALNGLELAKDELQRANGMTIEFLVEDARSTAPESVTALRRLLDVQKVQFVIGGLTSSGVLAAAPLAQERGVLFFTPAASAPGIPEIGNMIFRNWQSDTLLTSAFAKWARTELKTDSLAIVSVGNDYGNTNATVFADVFTHAGGRVEARSTFPQGAADYKPYVAQLAKSKAAGAYVVAYPDEYRGMFRELTKQHVRPRVLLVSDTFFSPELGVELAKSAEGAYCAVGAKPDSSYQPRARFISSYKSRFGVDPGLVSDTAYDALYLVVDGIKKSDGTPRGVSNYLLGVKNYQGAAGDTTFTATGDVVGGVDVYRLHDGKFEHIKTLRGN